MSENIYETSDQLVPRHAKEQRLKQRGMVLALWTLWFGQDLIGRSFGAPIARSRLPNRGA